MKQPLWQKAAAFAARTHAHQKRDDDRTPYFSHPARVATTVSAVFGCEDERALAAAYLHDTLENTDEGYDDLKEHFGGSVADLVVALTKNMMLPKRERDKEYYKRLGKADWLARLIKLADELDNLCDVRTGEKEGTGEEQEKVRRIIALCRSDRKKHPEVARGVSALKKVLKAKQLA